MPVKVGLDFGTTTSILSYLDGPELSPFHYGGRTGGTPYIPSVVAYTPKSLFIGEQAIHRVTEGASLYRYFKMLLTEEKSEHWPEAYGPYAREAMSPAQVAADFIGELVSGSSPGRRRLAPGRTDRDAFRPAVGEELGGLVVSVPQVWSEPRAHGRQQLRAIVSDLGLPLMQLISEPVAAAAYFSYKYRRAQGEPYRGNLLICDMGGGTFDVTLCALSEGRVEVLCNAGNGERGLGIAGAHFDHALLEAQLGRVEPQVMAEFLVALDIQKKLASNTTRLLTYLQNDPGERPLPIYVVSTVLGSQQTLRFHFDDVERAFAPVRAGIREVLGRVTREAGRRGHSVDKVVLVGGFSKFPLVQLAVGEFFGEGDLSANRKLLDLDTLRQDEMAFAISFGACLVANGMVEVSEKYEHAVGIVVTNTSGEDEEVELIPAGKSLDVLDAPAFCLWPDGSRRRFRITRDTVEAEIFIRPSGGGERWMKKLSLRGVPNRHVEGNRWFLGARVDPSKIPYLIIEDERCRKVEEYPLGQLIPDIIMDAA